MNVENKIEDDYKPKDEVEIKTPGDQSVVALAAEYAASLQIFDTKKPEEKPSEAFSNA